MLTILRAGLATPTTMDADAYREFCWGAGLDLAASGYGLLLAVDDCSGDVFTAVIDDVEYVRLLIESSEVDVPSDKITRMLPEWPDLRLEAATVWP
ncbi:hypothetical protein ABZ766_26775 [Streptomyces sp. NPDC006670]|uniref:hypothetical protein n=1 Tax=Streptomyces sp. NPDC006670 TaxID=3154476 RepID=UPI0034084103